MPSRTARWFAIALVAFLFAQPVPFLAFAQDTGDPPCCCKGKNASCCRRSHGRMAHGDTPHGETSGPALFSRDCSGRCQVSIRKSQPVAATFAPLGLGAELAPAMTPALAWAGWIPSARQDAALFERPPPFQA